MPLPDIFYNQTFTSSRLPPHTTRLMSREFIISNAPTLTNTQKMRESERRERKYTCINIDFRIYKHISRRGITVCSLMFISIRAPIALLPCVCSSRIHANMPHAHLRERERARGAICLKLIYELSFDWLAVCWMTSVHVFVPHHWSIDVLWVNVYKRGGGKSPTPFLSLFHEFSKSIEFIYKPIRNKNSDE